MKQSNMSEATVKVDHSLQQATKSIKKPQAKYPAPLSFRPIDENERQAVIAAARGMSVSEYIRKCVVGENSPPKKRSMRVPVKDEQNLSQILALLGQSRIANNLNQLAHHANTGSLLLDNETLMQIKEAYGHVLEMRKALIAALVILPQ